VEISSLVFEMRRSQGFRDAQTHSLTDVPSGTKGFQWQRHINQLHINLIQRSRELICQYRQGKSHYMMHILSTLVLCFQQTFHKQDVIAKNNLSASFSMRCSRSRVEQICISTESGSAQHCIPYSRSCHVQVH